MGHREMAGRISSSHRTVAIVPARYCSSRLPGKPLADVAGVPLIIRVLRGLDGSVDRIVVATDDRRILDIVKENGFEAVLTGEAETGTKRVFMAWESLGCPGERIINVQGDEPLVNSSWISALTSVSPGDDLVTTLARRVPHSQAGSPDSVNVVTDCFGEALYFSRYPVPHGADELLEHIGIYCFSPDSLKRCIGAGSTALSRTERLEQLAWLERGIRIKVIEGVYEGIGVDTPDDLEKAVRYFKNR